MPKVKKIDNENNKLRLHKVEKKMVEKDEVKIDKNKVRKLTLEEKESMKTLIPTLEDHERIQLFHFIRMDNIKYTKQQNGILLNLKNATDEFNFKIFTYINKCVENQKYRQ